MTDIAIRQQLRDAEDAATDWRRRAEHAEAQVKLAGERMRQAEDTMRGMVSDWCECFTCSKRRSV